MSLILKDYAQTPRLLENARHQRNNARKTRFDCFLIATQHDATGQYRRQQCDRRRLLRLKHLTPPTAAREFLVCTLETANHADCPDCIREPFARPGPTTLHNYISFEGQHSRTSPAMPAPSSYPPFRPSALGSSVVLHSLAILRANRTSKGRYRRGYPPDTPNSPAAW